MNVTRLLVPLSVLCTCTCACGILFPFDDFDPAATGTIPVADDGGATLPPSAGRAMDFVISVAVDADLRLPPGQTTGLKVRVERLIAKGGERRRIQLSALIDTQALTDITSAVPANVEPEEATPTVEKTIAIAVGTTASPRDLPLRIHGESDETKHDLDITVRLRGPSCTLDTTFGASGESTYSTYDQRPPYPQLRAAPSGGGVYMLEERLDIVRPYAGVMHMSERGAPSVWDTPRVNISDQVHAFMTVGSDGVYVASTDEITRTIPMPLAANGEQGGVEPNDWKPNGPPAECQELLAIDAADKTEGGARTLCAIGSGSIGWRVDHWRASGSVTRGERIPLVGVGRAALGALRSNVACGTITDGMNRHQLAVLRWTRQTGAADPAFGSPPGRFALLPESYGYDCLVVDNDDHLLVLGALTNEQDATWIGVDGRGGIDNAFGDAGVAALPVEMRPHETTLLGVYGDSVVSLHGETVSFHGRRNGQLQSKNECNLGTRLGIAHILAATLDSFGRLWVYTSDASFRRVWL